MLIFGDHALNLEQQIILDRATNGALQEDDLHTGTTKLVDQQRLMGLAAGEPIGSMGIETLHVASSSTKPSAAMRSCNEVT